MTRAAISRRTFLGACAVIGAGTLGSARAEVDSKLGAENEKTIRRWYASWVKTKDWREAEKMLADDFTFTSAAGDNHISKTEFKTNCWDTQVNYINRFDLLHVFANGNAAFVMYDCSTGNDKRLRNVEFLQLGDGRIKSIECYFGEKSSFPSAISKKVG